MGSSPVRVDIGCGTTKEPGAIGVDSAYVLGIDVLADAEHLPFHSDSLDIIYLSHVLEHVTSLIDALEEVWRISKAGTRVHVWSPHFSCGLYAWSDPTHRRTFTSKTFDYFESANDFNYYSCARFAVLRRELHLGLRRDRRAASSLERFAMAATQVVTGAIEALANAGRLTQILCERTWAMWIGFEEVYVVLSAVKDVQGRKWNGATVTATAGHTAGHNGL
ncbi:MAG: class I SAM-dependent methyltransferase, partial [Chloroflexota bacterium]